MIRYLLLVVVLLFSRPGIAENTSEDPGIPCKDTRDCISFSNELKHSICQNGYCLCETGGEMKNCSSIEAIQRNAKATGSQIHRPCKHDQDCNFRRGVCNTTISQCECQKNYVVASDFRTCLQKATSINSACIDDRQCLAFLPNTTCLDGKCSCALGYYFVKDTCYKKIGFGFPCTKMEECGHIEAGICTDKNVCGCNEETVISLNKTACLAVAHAINADCIEEAQCSTKFSYAMCIDQKCQCRYSYHYEPDLNRCFASKALKEACENIFECFQETDDTEHPYEKAVTCENNTCVCMESYTEADGRCVSTASCLRSALPLLFLSWFVLDAFSSRV